MACRLVVAKPFIWTNGGILLIRPLGTNFSENWSEIHTFSFQKMHFTTSFAKLRPFRLGLSVLLLLRIYLWENGAVSAAGTTHVLTSSGIKLSFYSESILIRLDIYTHTGVCSIFNFVVFMFNVFVWVFCYFSVHHFLCFMSMRMDNKCVWFKYQ